MVPDSSDQRDAVPLPSVRDTPVYTADGFYFGDAVDLAVDLFDGEAEALLVTDLESAFASELEIGSEGVRIPYRNVRGVGDVIVLTPPVTRENVVGDAAEAVRRGGPDGSETSRASRTTGERSEPNGPNAVEE